MPISACANNLMNLQPTCKSLESLCKKAIGRNVEYFWKFFSENRSTLDYGIFECLRK